MTTPIEASAVEILDLPEDVAVRRQFGDGNRRWLRFYTYGFAATATLYALHVLAEARYLGLLLPAANLLVIWAFVQGADRESGRAAFRHLLTVYLLLQIAFLVAYDPAPPQGREILAFVVPVLLVPLRFELIHTGLLYLLLYLAAIAPTAVTAASTGQLPPLAMPVSLTLFFVASAAASVATTRRRYSSFISQFRVQSSRHRERRRMREELDYARRIQLQMLPQGDPRVTGHDIRGICLPATEVGGDYYEYFERGDDEIAIAIGDVAGHGVASGLLLSGIRSCLYLLDPEQLPPAEILSRLNRMVRDTNESRMFISLLYAVVDHRRHSVVLSSAGHPPLLHYSRPDGRVSEIGQGAPPLGTRLEASFVESRFDFGSGDVLLLLTDGLHETIDHREEPYGLERLVRVLGENAERPAREIREAILSDVWNFKGNAEQEDDITLVVVKAD